MKLTVASTIGQTSTLTVSDAIFQAPANPQLIAQAVRVYMGNQRQGTSKTKTRSEINRTKKKWYKQKGTGGARHGARTPSLFVGGGVAHGPTGTQNYSRVMPVTMRRQALSVALSMQIKNIIISEDLHQLDGKTAPAAKLLTKMLPESKHILVVLSKMEPLIYRSLRNIDRVLMTTATRLNVFEVAFADSIIMTKDAVKDLEARLTLAPKAEKTVSAEKTADIEIVETVAEAKPAKKKVTAKPAAKKTVKAAASTEKAEKPAKVAKKTTK